MLKPAARFVGLPIARLRCAASELSTLLGKSSQSRFHLREKRRSGHFVMIRESQKNDENAYDACIQTLSVVTRRPLQTSFGSQFFRALARVCYQLISTMTKSAQMLALTKSLMHARACARTKADNSIATRALLTRNRSVLEVFFI